MVVHRMGRATAMRIATVSVADEQEGLFFRRMVERIQKGTCVLLLGPGAMFDPADADHTPLAVLLARRLADDPRIAAECEGSVRDNLRYVAQQRLEATRGDREQLCFSVQDFYTQYRDATTEFLENLARLPFRMFVTTSPDDLLFNSLKVPAVGRAPRRSHFNFRRNPDERLAPPTIKEPLVYHLYGHISDADSLVLTESDLIEFLVAIARESPRLPSLITSMLGDPDTTFLFVGFGFQQWHLRVLLHVLKIHGHHKRPLALEDRSFFQHPEQKETVGFFSAGGREITFHALGWEDFARRLCEFYFQAAGGAPAEAPEPPADAPKAFLSYASENEAEVTRLGEELRRRGIAVWQDKQNLRGGDNWQTVLRDVVGKRVDYFVFVQSPQMMQRVAGVFYDELLEALEKQKLMRHGLRFIVPAMLAPCELEPRLAQLKLVSVDLATSDGIAQLVDLIMQDHRVRKGLERPDTVVK